MQLPALDRCGRKSARGRRGVGRVGDRGGGGSSTETALSIQPPGYSKHARSCAERGLGWGAQAGACARPRRTENRPSQRTAEVAEVGEVPEPCASHDPEVTRDLPHHPEGLKRVHRIQCIGTLDIDVAQDLGAVGPEPVKRGLRGDRPVRRDADCAPTCAWTIKGGRRRRAAEIGRGRSVSGGAVRAGGDYRDAAHACTQKPDLRGTGSALQYRAQGSDSPQTPRGIVHGSTKSGRQRQLVSSVKTPTMHRVTSGKATRRVGCSSPPPM